MDTLGKSPSFWRLRGPGGVGSQVLPRVHKARITLVIVLQVLTSGEATSCSSTATAFVTATQNCRTSCTKIMCKSPVCKRLNLSLAPPLEEFRGYTTVRRDRTTGGGGAMCLVCHSCTFSEWDTTDIITHDGTTEVLGVEVRLGGSLLRIANIYIPPTSSCPTGYSLSFDNLRNAKGDYLIMGDFNAHHPSLYSQTEDDQAAKRGESLDAAVSLTVSAAILRSSVVPDVTLISGHLLLDSTWSTHTTLGSDHLPILTRLPGLSTAPRRARSYMNFLRRDWEGFERETEFLFSSLGPPPLSCAKGEKEFRKVLATAAIHNIPAGYQKDFRGHRIPEAVRSLVCLFRCPGIVLPTGDQVRVAAQEAGGSGVAGFAKRRGGWTGNLLRRPGDARGLP